MDKIRVAVIGAGYLGRFHGQKYTRMAGADLVGVVDTDRRSAEALAGELGTRAFTSHHDVLDRVDAASIVVPTPVHFDVSMDFLAHDVDLLIEKPITSSLSEADRLIAFAENRGAIIQVGHLERFNPAVVACEDLIGTPQFIESHRLSTYQPRGTDVSVVLDLMIHDIDLISNFVRSEIRSLHAAGIPVISGLVDIANARLEFENGCVANVTASRISNRTQRKIRLFQRDAYISLDFAKREITVIRKDRQQDGGVIPGMEIDQRCFSQGDALDAELRAFIRCVRRREAPEVTGQMGREALSIALNIQEQIQRSTQRLGR